ncbi:DNA repair protein RadC [Shewanella algae]|uniref:JAB domain-containing protein n=1 Tax=Shewanella TaxID=22 RepID=UPI0011840AC6|nr:MULTISPECIES: JAB domain-containing protein [Shewanella]QYK05814.1 JAB domain-containing protein [Shewanella zhangzhouensis]TVP06948.1 DNA repair protein RadC [Shewanella algae]TWU63732.1 DNA repair protein RadC [Shewanella algae]BCV39484.1 DNA repair protein RadC [Shewanella algae]
MAIIREINVKYQFREINSELAEKELKRPAQTAEVFDYLKYESKEVFVVANLTSQNTINCVEVVATGTVNSISMRAVEVLRSAVILNMPSVILIHNHPSGNPEPSRHDIAFTRKVVEAGKLLDITVIDHVIIGLNQHHSLRESHSDIFE